MALRRPGGCPHATKAPLLHTGLEMAHSRARYLFESTERDKSTYELGLVGGGFACARLSLVDGEASFFEGHLVVYLAVEASFRRPRWFSLSTERRPLFLASWSAYMLGGLARV